MTESTQRRKMQVRSEEQEQNEPKVPQAPKAEEKELQIEESDGGLQKLLIAERWWDRLSTTEKIANWQRNSNLLDLSKFTCQELTSLAWNRGWLPIQERVSTATHNFYSQKFATMMGHPYFSSQNYQKYYPSESELDEVSENESFIKDESSVSINKDPQDPLDVIQFPELQGKPKKLRKLNEKQDIQINTEPYIVKPPHSNFD